jgi:hypothetical protein
MANNIKPRPRGALSMVLGGSLVLLGVVFLVLQLFNFDVAFSRSMWPLLIIAAGVYLFGVAFFSNVKEGEPFAVLGSIVTVLGLLLFYQNSTGHWQNWAYTWALLMPTSVGVGQMVFGVIKHKAETVRTGMRLTFIGAVMFLVGYFFFEVVIGIGGHRSRGLAIVRYGWPITLVGIGGILILNYVLGNPTSKPPQAGSPQ